MAEKKNVPEIRFEGFTEPWEQRKLGDVVEIIDGDRGINYPNGDDFQEYGHTLFLSAANITKNGFSFKSSQYITEAKSESLGNGKLQLNDIVLTSRGSLGHVAWYSEKIRRQIQYLRINSGMLLLRPMDDMIPCFVEQFLNSSMGKKQIELISFGSAQPQLTKKDVFNYHIPIADTNEQTAIGNFFRNLDDTIALKKQQYEKTLNIKKAMLDKMFPKNGSDAPEIRFAGFSEPWVVRELGDVVSVTMGQSPDSKNYTDNSNDYILVQGNADMRNGLVVPRVWTTQITKTADKGSIIFSVRAPVGDVGKTSYDVVLGRGVAGIKGNEFIYQNLVKMNLFGHWEKIAQGSTFESINADDLNGVLVLFPGEAEQTAIGNFFRNLDNLIQAQGQELEKLQTIKKACLEKMFV